MIDVAALTIDRPCFIERLCRFKRDGDKKINLAKFVCLLVQLHNSHPSLLGPQDDMRRFDELKQLDEKSRNKLRAILSVSDANAINGLSQLRGKLTRRQSEALESILNSTFLGKAARVSTPFPKRPQFADTLQTRNYSDLNKVLSDIEGSLTVHRTRIENLASSLHMIDERYAAGDIAGSLELIIRTLDTGGWSHALLRRIILIRENLPEGFEDQRIESLVQQANPKLISVASLIHAYTPDQNILTIKRSILNLGDKGAINRYSRFISRIPVLPFARSVEDLAGFLSEVEKCSLIDAVILAKFNSHLFSLLDFPVLREIVSRMGCAELFEKLVATYDVNDVDSEYVFFQQSSAWLEYEPVRQYRILLDNYYDSSHDESNNLSPALLLTLKNWVGTPKLGDLVSKVSAFTRHRYLSLSKLESSGTATRSAIFNFWLQQSEGQIGFEKNDLFSLMGLTRDLARTVPIKATRTAAKFAQDELVRLVLLLLLAKRSKNELDSFNLRKLLAEIALKSYGGSLVRLVQHYQVSHPYISEYIYDIATEDFLAKLTKLAPHRSDIPEIRASLHEWMAGFTNDEHYRQRARAVRIDHQINRVRNEIDDHRIYVDPSRFSLWIQDEMMIELNAALTSTGTGKKTIAVNCDEAILSFVVTQCYIAFCSNSVFGIESFIGRRIRHGTFHGHLYSSVINEIEKNEKYQPLFRTQQFTLRWNAWKDQYSKALEEIIANRLHVQAKTKPLGLLHCDNFGATKVEILNAAVKNISIGYTETKSVSGVDQTITDYCWRLAEIDLVAVTRFLKAQQTPLKNLRFLEEQVVPAAGPANQKLADSFTRDLHLLIDRKLSSMLGWFKRPSIVAPKASMSLLFDATVAEVRDTISDFDPQSGDSNQDNIELVGDVYHLVYDSLAVVVANAAKHGDRKQPVKRQFKIIPGKEKRLVVDISSSIKPSESADDVSISIERRKAANFHDANLYQGKSGISKLKLLAYTRQDFCLDKYEVVGNEVIVRLSYVLEH